MTPLTATLTGGKGHGRLVEIPLERLPQRLDYVTASGTVAYERVGHTAEYRPAAVLDKLAAPAQRKPGKRAAKKVAATPPAFQATRS